MTPQFAPVEREAALTEGQRTIVHEFMQTHGTIDWRTTSRWERDSLGLGENGVNFAVDLHKLVVSYPPAMEEQTRNNLNSLFGSKTDYSIMQGEDQNGNPAFIVAYTGLNKEQITALKKFADGNPRYGTYSNQESGVEITISEDGIVVTAPHTEPYPGWHISAYMRNLLGSDYSVLAYQGRGTATINVAYVTTLPGFNTEQVDELHGFISSQGNLGVRGRMVYDNPESDVTVVLSGYAMYITFPPEIEQQMNDYLAKVVRLPGFSTIRTETEDGKVNLYLAYTGLNTQQMDAISQFASGAGTTQTISNPETGVEIAMSQDNITITCPANSAFLIESYYLNQLFPNLSVTTVEGEDVATLTVTK